MSEGGGPAQDHGFATESSESGGRTLVEGTTFAVCGAGGEMYPQLAHGLFVRDARIISRWNLTIDDAPIEALRGFTEEPYAGVFVGRAPTRQGQLEPTLLVERRRYVGSGMREDLLLSNYGHESAGAEVTLRIAADFADVFAVKLGRTTTLDDVVVTASGDEWRARFTHPRGSREVRVHARGAVATVDGLSFRAVVPPHGTWCAPLQVETSIDDRPLPPRFPIDLPIEKAAPAQRMSEWRRSNPSFLTDSLSLNAALGRSETDLAALHISDPTQPDLTVIAAGAPWFMALFGRDSLIASWMTLAVNQALAVGTLRTLAHYQGTTLDPMTEEQPGKILHELRVGTNPSRALGGAESYYGSIDSTPLFVMLLGELARWGTDLDIIRELLPAADRALTWIDHHGDRDGDGFVEYLRGTDRGLRNQGWKDSDDGITFADGTVAQPPIALAEVQGYVYAAYLARGRLAEIVGASEEADDWRERAATLKSRFDAAFWLDEPGYFALGLDAQKRPIDAMASNMGHCLWTGIAGKARAAVTAQRLVDPAMFTGYGIRTLASSMGAYNPASYHNGSVWPHDTALAVVGLVRYGHIGAAQRIARGLVDAATYFAGRLPEVFCGFDRAHAPGPVPYPTSCSPQAWAAAAPIALVTSLLRLAPDVPAGHVALSPVLPPEWGTLQASGVPLGTERMTITVRRDGHWSTAGCDDLQIVAPPDARAP